MVVVDVKKNILLLGAKTLLLRKFFFEEGIEKVQDTFVSYFQNSYLLSIKRFTMFTWMYVRANFRKQKIN